MLQPLGESLRRNVFSFFVPTQSIVSGGLDLVTGSCHSMLARSCSCTGMPHKGGKMNPACLAKSPKGDSQCQNFSQSPRNPCHLQNLSCPHPDMSLLSPQLNGQCLPLLCISWAKSAFTHTFIQTSFTDTHTLPDCAGGFHRPELTSCTYWRTLLCHSRSLLPSSNVGPRAC